ncbi:MAG: Gfo/Idh/MocA family oxidoreductase [Candidatus Thermoplasmatota archaeon]|nr:Gfo/Idh/MocA family oxidoreductase [Candidatus Thermoplasmatota archaeon]
MARRIGVVGCGRWGSRHLVALQNLVDEADISCIVACDVDATALKWIGGDDILLHNDPNTLVEQFNLDSVIVATPNETHYELGNTFLKKGIDVFLEKPIATTFEDASSLVSTSIHRGKMLKSGFLLRFHPCIIDARAQIRTGRIGAIQTIRYSKNAQRQGDDSAHALDALAIHGIDLAEFLLDGQTPCRISEVIGSHTSCALTLEYPNQVEIAIDVGWGADADIAELEVIGQNGRIIVQLQQHGQYEIVDRQSRIEVVKSKHSPLEAVLLDFLEGDVTSMAASTGSILRTIKCVEQARLQLISSGYPKTRELKR